MDNLYSRTQNDNGTYNTRCLHCFMTVASAVESAEELNQLEKRHACPEKVLAELMEQKTHAAPLAARVH